MIPPWSYIWIYVPDSTDFGEIQKMWSFVLSLPSEDRSWVQGSDQLAYGFKNRSDAVIFKLSFKL